jgi:hypothetical protein
MAYIGHTHGENCNPRCMRPRGRPSCPVCWHSLLNAADKKRLQAADIEYQGRTGVR